MAVNQPIKSMNNVGGESPYKNSKTRLWAMFHYSIEEVKLLQSNPHFPKKKVHY